MDVRSKQASVSEALRKAIADSGFALLEIERQTGVSNAAIHRFLHGKRGLTLSTVDKLAEFFGLELVERRRKP